MQVNPFVRFDVDLEALTDAMWEFVTDPRPSRNERPVVKALDDIHPDSVDVLARMMTAAAATAGGIRPAADPVVADLGAERALFGAWLALLSIVRIVAIRLDRTEADVTEEIVSVLGAQ